MYDAYASKLHSDRGFLPLFAGADIVLKVPLLRRVLVAWGLVPVSSESLKRNLALEYPHNILTLLPGGISEMFYGLQEEQIILEKRKGFVKVALQTGASLVPCYALGANQVYTRWFGQDSIFYRISSLLRISILAVSGCCAPQRLLYLLVVAREVGNTFRVRASQAKDGSCTGSGNSC